MTLDEFIEEVCQRPLPTNPMARIRTLAKELAEGVSLNIWDVHFAAFYSLNHERGYAGNHPRDEIKIYFDRRWNSEYKLIRVLEVNGYLEERKEGNFYVSSMAFDLLDEVEPVNTFISYKRSESSAFALLVLARLKAAGLEPFLDLSIEPGDEWHNQLEERIKACDYFIVLLNEKTLNSEVTRKEIQWAVDYNCVILPIWHPDFVYQSGDWPVSDAVDAVLKNNHTIRVLEESALAYNNAIVELLNKFGITP